MKRIYPYLNNTGYSKSDVYIEEKMERNHGYENTHTKKIMYHEKKQNWLVCLLAS